MTFGFGRILVAALMLAGVANTALACQGSKVLFEDKFDSADPTWGPESDKFKIGGGQAVVRPPGGLYFWSWNTGFLFEDADICYSSTMLDKPTDPTLSYGGLMFWVADNENFYTFITASNGYFKVGRRLSGNWVTDPIGWTVSPSLKQGPGQANTVRVKLEGNQVTAEINGTKAVTFKAQPPDRPSAIGILSGSGPEPGSWAFSGLKVTNVK
jgi:hypothetical protein